MRISWNRISDWLPIVFHFGTENWEEQLKKSTLYEVVLSYQVKHVEDQKQVVEGFVNSLEMQK